MSLGTVLGSLAAALRRPSRSLRHPWHGLEATYRTNEFFNQISIHIVHKKGLQKDAFWDSKRLRTDPKIKPKLNCERVASWKQIVSIWVPIRADSGGVELPEVYARSFCQMESGGLGCLLGGLG